MIAGGYTVLALLWIWGSDRLVAVIARGDAELANLLQTAKGSAYVVATGVALYLAIAWVNARQRRLAAEKRLVEEMLIVSRRLEALGTLAGTVAHDFNNVLTVIRSVAGLMKLENFDVHTVPTHTEEIERAASQAEQLIRQMMLFMRDAPLAFVRGDLGNVVNDSLPVLKRAAGSDIVFTVRLREGLPPVSFVRAQVETMLLNLVINARDAVGQVREKSITVEVYLRSLRGYRSLFHAESVTGDFVTISVEDNGCGIPRENLARVFSPFFTTKPPGSGTGLGLTSVLRVMQTHGGWVEVESQPGRGTSFFLFFPVATESRSRELSDGI